MVKQTGVLQKQQSEFVREGEDDVKVGISEICRRIRQPRITGDNSPSIELAVASYSAIFQHLSSPTLKVDSSGVGRS